MESIVVVSASEVFEKMRKGLIPLFVTYSNVP
jgi:hypothetical protein